VNNARKKNLIVIPTPMQMFVKRIKIKESVIFLLVNVIASAIISDKSVNNLNLTATRIKTNV